MPRVHRLDLTNQTFGQWSVISKSHKNKYGEIFWLCKCTCGTQRPVVARSLMRGISVSCGCTSKDWCRTHGMENTATYGIWAHMIQRCHNPNHKQFSHYGARGISVCQPWRDSFEAFFADMGERPEGLSIDRLDNNGNYEPGNCEWRTATQQMRNRRNTKYLTLNGETKPLGDWADRFEMSQGLLQHRVAAGWSDEDILTKPVDNRFNRYKRAE